MERGQRFMLTCLFETDTMEDGTVKFIPCMIKEGVKGYFPMRGNVDDFQAPWYFGNDHKTCQKLCEQYNKELGLTPKDREEILISSLNAHL